MQKNQLILSTVICCVIAYFLTFILHGYAHTIIAYCNNLNDDPWIVITNNQLWLQNVHENSEYLQLDQQGYFFKIGIIGLTGYAINWALLLMSFTRLQMVKGHRLNFYYWMVVWNLTAVLGYIPHHLLNTVHIDLVFHQMGISVWMIYVIGGGSALFILFVLFYYLLPGIFDRLDIDRLSLRKTYFALSLFIVLFYSTVRFIFVYDDELIHNGLDLLHILNVMFLVKVIVFSIICFTIKLNSPKEI